MDLSLGWERGEWEITDVHPDFAGGVWNHDFGGFEGVVVVFFHHEISTDCEFASCVNG